MKTILCYGDSNTWGYNPSTANRFDINTRWTGVLQNELGPTCRVLEEGLNGRTTVWDDPIEGHKNGLDQLIPCIESKKPFDLISLMLGTNDLKARFSVSAQDIAQGIRVLIRIIQRSETGSHGQSPAILLMAPPPLGQLTEFADMFEGGECKSRHFARHYGDVAQDLGVFFFDTAKIITSSNIDGIHFEADEHRKLGIAIANRIEEILT